MKRFYQWIIILVLILVTTTACNGGEEANGKEKGNVLDRVEDSGVLRVGFEGTYQPFNYLDDHNKYAGFDVDGSMSRNWTLEMVNFLNSYRAPLASLSVKIRGKNAPSFNREAS
ncbi:hypothetical protein KK120_06450, partial [Virgibacillus dakarensis]|nr:hypothetical protein [Virgibacillus dakarensis]